MPDELKKTQLRTLQYFYVDGSFEFGLGLMSLLLAVYFYAEAHLQGWLGAVVDASLVLVMIGGAALIKLLIRRLKERITWPRTGYVSYPPRPAAQQARRIVLALVVGGLAGAAATLIVMEARHQFAVLPLISGLLFGLVIAFLGWRSSIPRFTLLGLLSGLLGTVLAFSGLADSLSLIAYYAAFAVILLFTGACVLRTYLHQNPVPKAGDL